jgi:hypothetical protein
MGGEYSKVKHEDHSRGEDDSIRCAGSPKDREDKKKDVRSSLGKGSRVLDIWDFFF